MLTPEDVAQWTIIRPFTPQHRTDIIAHLSGSLDYSYHSRKRPRVACALLGYLYEHESDPYRKELLLEVTWMILRIYNRLSEYKQKLGLPGLDEDDLVPTTRTPCRITYL